ncbi:MAG: Ig-like domain-containing protein [Nitrospirae bacterium]|nr:Ig-like domain-containing protein [Nitrospirota bacterium]
MIRIKIFTFCIAIVSVLTAVPGLMGCNQHSSTLESVSITPAAQSMVKGTTQQLTAIGTFSNGMNLTWSQVVTWSSDNTAVATVSNTAGSNGIVTSVDIGTAAITAYDAANNISGTARIDVTVPEAISVIPTNPYMALGATHQFAAIALFSNGTVTQVITTFAKWTAISTGDATIIDTPGVIGNGIVSAGTVTGTTVIQASDPTMSGATGATTLTVTSTPLTAIALDPINPIVSMSTTTLRFTAIGTFQDGQTTQTLTPSVTASWNWSSSNTGIVTIDNTGLARVVAAGTVTITAKDPITGVSGNTTLTLQ